MATAQILPDNDTVVAEILIAAPPERVFEALSDPRQIPHWWGQKGLYRLTEASADFRVGGKWRNAGVSHDGKPFYVEGEYLEIDPPRLVVHTWNPSFDDLPTTIVRWELEPRPVHLLGHGGPNRAGTGTVVKIRHSGFGNVESARGHGEGWKRVLGWIQGYVERGETIETGTA